MANKEYVKVPLCKERLDLARRLAGLSRKKLAEKSGVSDTTIRRAEKTGYINDQHMFELAFALDVTKAFLSGEKSWNAVAKAMKTVSDFKDSAALALALEYMAENVEV